MSKNSCEQFVKLCITFLFCFCLFFPLAEMFLTVLPRTKNNENRVLAKFPDVNIKRLDAFPKQFDTYFNDNFGARNQLVSIYNQFTKQLLHINSHDAIVIAGKNGHLYWASMSLPQHKLFASFTKKQVDTIIDKFKTRNEWLKKRGIKFYVLFAPAKQSIYPEFLPFSLTNFGISSHAEQIYARLQNEIPDLNMIDARQDLLEHKKKYTVYQKTDNHWSAYGAWLASNKLTSRIHLDFPNVNATPLSNFKIKYDWENGSNLASILNLSESMKEYHIKLIPKFNRKAKDGMKAKYPPTKNFGYAAEYEIVKEVADTSLPKAVIIRDSFCSSVLPFLSENFSKSVYIWDGWQYKENREIIVKEKPAIVILVVSDEKLDEMLKW